MAQTHVHAQGGVAFHAVMGGHALNGGADVLHHGREMDAGLTACNAQPVCVADAVRQVGRRDEGLAGHAPVVQAIAAHGSALHESDRGLGGGGDIGGHQSGGPAADDDEVAVEAFGP